MIANATTLILGAGASAPLGYPVGSQLRTDIIKGTSPEYLRYLHRESHGLSKFSTYEEMIYRFKESHVASIDAFLAEPENQRFADIGRGAIASALIGYENPQCDPDWYFDLFNAIRFRSDPKRTHKLKVVTFNYDLSLEFFLINAFKHTYGLSNEDAREAFDSNIEVNHVYGDLGILSDFSKVGDARAYGVHDGSVRAILTAIHRIHIIGRHDHRKEAFQNAFEAISTAEFVAILGYGFDQLNNENLQLQKAIGGKQPFATGFGIGCGGRARLSLITEASGMVMGSKTEGVRAFLEETDFLRWINEPGATAQTVTGLIGHVFVTSILPYRR